MGCVLYSWGAGLGRRFYYWVYGLSVHSEHKTTCARCYVLEPLSSCYLWGEIFLKLFTLVRSLISLGELFGNPKAPLRWVSFFGPQFWERCSQRTTFAKGGWFCLIGVVCANVMGNPLTTCFSTVHWHENYGIYLSLCLGWIGWCRELLWGYCSAGLGYPSGLLGRFGVWFPIALCGACGEKEMPDVLRGLRKLFMIWKSFFSTLLEWAAAVGLFLSLLS